MRIALVDADSIYFRAAMVNQNKKEIRTIINRTMKEIEIEATGGGFADLHMLVAVKGHGNFRKDLYPEYKAQRPTLEPKIREALAYGWNYMIEKYDAKKADGMEADDLVSIWAAECRVNDDDHVVVGIDKDLKQIPGNHYNFVKKEHDYVDDDTANYNLMLQCITGDTSDNIPGIKGIGPKKAAKILTGVPMDRRWSRVRAAWRGHRAGDPELSRRLLTMLTSWEEYESIRSSLPSEATVSQQDVCSKGQDNIQDS